MFSEASNFTSRKASKIGNQNFHCSSKNSGCSRSQATGYLSKRIGKKWCATVTSTLDWQKFLAFSQSVTLRILPSNKWQLNITLLMKTSISFTDSNVLNKTPLFEQPAWWKQSHKAFATKIWIALSHTNHAAPHLNYRTDRWVVN